MPKLLFIALGHLSKGDITIAAEFARQLPDDSFGVCFVTTAETRLYVEQYGLRAVALDAPTAQANLALFDQLVAAFQPEYLIAADVYTLEYSLHWSGLDFQTLRERYDLPLLSFDQYEWGSTRYLVDFYGNARRRFPPLIDQCDFVIRNCPLNKPQPGPRAAPASLFGAQFVGRRSDASRAYGQAGEKVIFLANSKWEYVNVSNLPSLERLMSWMPRLIHAHLAALNQPLTLIHVGPVSWDFPIAEQVRYRHFKGLSPDHYEQYLLNADLFITANVASVTLSKAVFGGVPSVVFQNHRVLDFRLLRNAERGCPAWLSPLAHEVDLVYPFRIFPWGWFEFLTPVLQDNPYQNCYATLPLFERRNVLQTLASLLYDPATIADQQGRQRAYVEQILQLPSAEQMFLSLVKQ